MKKDMSEAMLFRFFAGETTEQETDIIAAWLDEDPVRHQKRLNRMHNLYVVSIMCPEVCAAPETREKAGIVRRMKRSRIVRYASGIAAALLICFGVNYLFFSHRVKTLAEMPSKIEAPAGQHIRFTMSDGSVIDLNSGGSITYPSVFSGRERRVRLSGEAMFDVEPDANRPFVVETFSYEVRVLGTRFNVIADEEKNEFSTALLEGKVSVSHLSNNENVVLEPDMIASLRNGRLVTDKIKGMDDYLWPEGVISVGGLPFDRLAEKIEKSYNVRIVLERETPPVIKYTKLKIRISDGVDHAMRILSLASDFTYVYDTSENTITIK